jgi:hypothetical protein
MIVIGANVKYCSSNLKKVKMFKYCYDCGESDTNSIINLKGRVLPYLSHEVLIEYDLYMIGCTKCGNYILGPNDCELLDSVCKRIIDEF